MVTKDGDLKVMQKFKHGEELKHPVLSDGKPVLAAGEAQIAGSAKEGYFVLEFDNNSGHYKPSTASLEIGKSKLKEYINVLNDF